MDFDEYVYDHKSKKPKLDDENGASRRHRDRSDRHRSERHRSKGRHDDEREHKRSSRDKKSRDRERRDREKDKEREREREKKRRSRSHSRIERERDRDREKERELEAREREKRRRRSHSRIERERERDREMERELEARQMSTSTSILSPNHENNRSMVCLDIQDLFVKVLAICYPKLKENAILESLKGEARKTLGDYAFLGVVDICDQLRKDDPLLFTRVGPSDVAQKIKKAFESQKFEMIRTLFLNDAGILTFSLEGRWMAQRIKKMLNDGIDTWAPVIYDVETGGKAVFVFPTNTIHITPDRNADMVKAVYMKDALVNMFLYSGANVGSGFFDDRALKMARERFTEKRGKIVSKRSETSLFLAKGPSGPLDDVYTDLATLWYFACSYK